MITATKAPFLSTLSILTARFFSFGCAAISGQSLARQPSAAETSAEYVDYPVWYSDLDMSKAKGARILYLRIRHAAETLCESAATWGKKEGEACMRKATDEAVARVNSPMLSQYYQLRIKGDKAAPVQLAKTP